MWLFEDYPVILFKERGAFERKPSSWDNRKRQHEIWYFRRKSQHDIWVFCRKSQHAASALTLPWASGVADSDRAAGADVAYLGVGAADIGDADMFQERF